MRGLIMIAIYALAITGCAAPEPTEAATCTPTCTEYRITLTECAQDPALARAYAKR
ncbi:hypothetical protein [Nocardiopsis alba]|uniref:hypothetical protein n=1 Tax=Nocardiopsis alba TaxID=53437 RepID=UPI0033A0B119